MSLISKIFTSFVLFTFFFTQVFNGVSFAETIDKADKDGKTETVYDLIAVVIDTELDQDLGSYSGLRNKYPDKLASSTLGERVVRYVEDLRDSNTLTDVKLIYFDKKKETTADLARVLENLYVNGDGTHNNRLTGVVLVGDVPLPVVDKNGNRFASLFPYTDFENKAYIYDEGVDGFVFNPDNSFAKPEIWHGVIRAPEKSPKGSEQLAEYFDKNHLYYEEVPEYAKFEKKLFYSDLVHEEEAINGDVFKYYVDYLKSWEDLAYNRYNKFWAQEVSNKVTGNLELKPEKGQEAFAESLKNNDAMAQMPDIYTKQIIDQFLIPYFKIFTSHISKINEFAEGTGRYDSKDVDSTPVLITIKDEYTKMYLKEVNDALEKKVNEVVGLIEEPLDLLKSAKLSGYLSDPNGTKTDFKYTPDGLNTKDVLFRFHYQNELNAKFYVNGIESGILKNAKQCSVYLGSTKSENFDSNLNYVPKDGKYSILTRAIRADNPATVAPLHTVGVNTRLLSPTEANKLSGNKISSGAVIEDKPEYGISAFIDNTLFAENPLEKIFAKGDIIWKVNGKLIDSSYTFDQAIEESYQTLKSVIDAVKAKNLKDIEGLDIAMAPGKPLTTGTILNAGGNIGIEYYPKGSKEKKDVNFTFSVNKDGLTSNGNPAGEGGGPEVMVLLSRIGFPQGFESKFDFDAPTQGMIFTLYDTKNQGYANKGYDPSAGCNANSAGRNSDRCFYLLATMPVLDPAGSKAPVRVDVTGIGLKLMFPENVKRNDEYKNSGDSIDYQNHQNILQFPAGKKFEEIDDVYYNACYSGLPAVGTLDKDSNPYPFPLAGSGAAGDDLDIFGDFYGKLINNIASYVGNNGKDPKSAPGKVIWNNLENLDAGQIVVSNVGGVTVTLKDFSDRYGLFDGIDNDKDGIRDYEWRDKDQDGVYEQKFFDFEEEKMNPINSKDLGEIGRKLLSHNSIYTIPAGLSGTPFDVNLVVNVESTGQKISSVVLHNEPTEHTISEQLKSMGAFSMPIDNPRYVAFHSPPNPLPPYPKNNPKPGIVEQLIVSKLNTSIHYFPGKTNKIVYPNLFAVENYNQLVADLTKVADQIAAAPGSYRVFGKNVNPQSYTSVQIRDKILKDYLLPVISQQIDNPVDGFNLKAADTKKIYDALNWKNLNIDEKHQYVLKNYLSGTANAYVNDNTLFPSSGKEAYGYEAAYLVLDGEEDYFNMNFNKDLPEETAKEFNPLNFDEELAAESGKPAGSGAGGAGGSSEEKKDEGFEFVDLDQFLKETEEFVNYFSNIPEFKDSCSSAASASEERVQDKSGIDKETLAKSKAVKPLTSLSISANKEVFAANGSDKLEIIVNGDSGGGELVTLEVSQSGEIFNLSDGAGKNLISGSTTFNLVSTKNTGTAVFTVKSGAIVSNSIKITSAGTNLEVFTGEGSDSLLADGKSEIEISAQVIGANGKVDTEGVHSVKFSVVDAKFPNMVSFVGANIVETKAGTATVKIKSSKKAGDFKIRAEVTEGIYPIKEKELFLTAGEVTAIEILPESGILVANNQSKTKVNVILRDQFGNIANNAFSRVALFVNEKAHFDQTGDVAPSSAGLQLNAFDGFVGVDLFAEDKVGKTKVFAVLMDLELEEKLLKNEKIDFTKYIGATKEIEILEPKNLSLKLTLDKPSIAADGNSVISMKTELMANGKLAGSYNGPIDFKIVNDSFGRFLTAAPKKMIGGVLHEANVKFKSSKTAGEAEILVNVPGFVSNSAKFKVLPGKAVEIKMSAENEVIYTGGKKDTVVKADLVDENGNVVTTDNTTTISFEPTEKTAEFVKFSGAKSAIALNGSASTLIKGGKSSGKVNLVAKAKGVKDGLLSLKITKQVHDFEVKDFSPRVLYTSILGGSFGNKNGLAETFLFSGQVQSVTSTTFSNKEKQRLVGVDAYGKIDLMGSNLTANVLPATEKFPYQKISVKDNLAGKELMSMFYVPKGSSEVKLTKEMPKENGIFVKELAAGIFKQEGDEVHLVEKGEVKVKIDKFGRVTISDKKFELGLSDQQVPGFGLAILRSGEEIGTIIYKENFVDLNGATQDVKVVSELKQYFPGVYVEQSNPDSKYQWVSSFSGSGTHLAKGVYLVDSEKEIEDTQAAGTGFNSLESASENDGVGFDGKNKHMLLFAAGNSVGEANVPYASDAGINFGDPNIRLKVEGVMGVISKFSGYTKDVGKSLFVGPEEVKEMIKFDFNADGREDVLLVYEDGYIRLLENENSNRKFRDKGYIAKIFGGIVSAARIDVNNDGYDDLIVGTKESCKQNETCTSLFINENGHLKRSSLNLKLSSQDSKLLKMKAGDLNADGCEDLVVSDSGGAIRMFYNKNYGKKCGGLELTSAENSVFNFGISVNQSLNLKNDLFVYYPGIAVPDEDSFINFEFNNNSYNFVHLPKDGKLLNSTKQAVDVNGGTVNVGDKINYVITLKNGGSAISNMMLSDITAVSMSMVPDSLNCLDNGCSDKLKFEETGMSLRSKVISNISVPANGTRTIRYTMTVEQTSEVDFDLGNNFAAYKSAGKVAPSDNYLDVQVRPSVNPSGIITYIYSTGLTAKGQVKYAQTQADKTGKSGDDLYSEELAKQGLNAKDLINSIPGAGGTPQLSPGLQKQLSKMQGKSAQDKDFDGCSDSWDKAMNSYESSAAAVADSVKDLTSKLRCSGGGCLPIPYNYAFLAPDGATPGISLFAYGVPNPIGFAPFWPTNLVSSFRFYVNPTLTMGLGTSVCLGQFPASTCFAFAVPMDLVGGCPDFLGPVNDAIATAKKVVSNPDIGMATVISDGEASTGSDAFDMGGSYSDTDAPISAAGNVNIRVPGFPSVLTNWIDKQTDEIYNKLLDLPDFYFIYPDFSSLGGKFKKAGENFGKMQSMADVLRAISSIPFVQIEGKEVLIKVPSLSKDELEKWKRQAHFWIEYEEQQLKNIKEFWLCDENEQRKTLCDKATVNLTEMISSVKKMMDKLDKMANLPGDILKWRTLESKYASQLVCYLDAIMEFTGGYIRRQEKTVASWMKALEDATKTFRDWKIILDVVAEYQESCDECKNDRFSKLGILMTFFMAIPEPPIIPIPKWPDIVFDMSQLKMGTKIIWPDLVFMPEPITLPNLPTITFPEVIPDDYVLEIPGFEVPDYILNFPEIVMPDLPSLPPLPLPNLPDLPRPPKIPKIDAAIAKLAANLKPIFKILCLVKKGLVPVPESTLATEIETLTQPSVSATLPIVKQLGIQMPEIQYQYVEQIRANLKINFGIETDFIFQTVKEGAEEVNEKVEDFVEEVNSFTNFEERETYVEDQDLASVMESYQNFEAEIERYIASMETQEIPEKYELIAEAEYLDANNPLLNRSIAEIEKKILNEEQSDDPGIQQLANLRDSLIVYTKNLEQENAVLENIDGLENFGKMLAEKDQSVDLIASTGKVLGEDSAEKTSLFGKGAEKLFDTKIPKNLLAANYEPAELAKAQGKSTPPVPKGFFIVIGEKNENVLSYTSELSGPMQTIFSDVDEDKDQDLIYSMGGDVYLKTNYTNKPKVQEKGEIVIGLKSGVSDLMPKGGAMVDGLSSPYENNEKADLSWKKNSEAVAYEIEIRKSIYEKKAAYQYVVSVTELKNPEAPSFSLEELTNGNYYATVYALDKDGNRSVASSSAVLSPQECADKDKPMPAISEDNFSLSVFKTFELDTSNSFDSSGKIVEQFIEVLPFAKNVGTKIYPISKDKAVFKIGPFEKAEDLGKHKMKLHIKDQSGNSSAKEIFVNVFAPKISLDQTFARTSVVHGKVAPLVENLPFSLMRNRYIYRVVDGELKLVPRLDKIVTKAANGSKYYTNLNGEYEISDFNLEDMILVENALKQVVAEIDPVTGNIGKLAEGHKVVMKPAEAGKSPTKAEILDSKGSLLATVYLIADQNIDVKIWEEAKFEEGTFKGVNVNDLDPEDKLIFKKFPADDVYYPGGAALVDGEKGLVAVDTAGNVVILDKGVALKKKVNLHEKDPLVIEIIFGKKVMGEIYVAPGVDLQIIGPKDVPFATPREAKSIAKVTTNIDNELTKYDDNLKKAVKVLYNKGIIDNLNFDPGKPVNRGEFVKMLLDMLCIIPRPEAYKAESGFSDIQFKKELDWFYPYVKEASLLGLVHGYRGETNDKGLSPFKPDAEISRAEAVKVILEGLEMKGVINLDKVKLGDPWYEEFMLAAQDMTPYAVKPLKNNFIITEEEAKFPDKKLSKGELIEMTLRVLDVYDCSLVDKDGDGMSDFCEDKYKISEPSGDSDEDDLNNADECSYGTDPKDQDTDGGGVTDGAEILMGLNPKNPKDDKGQATEVSSKESAPSAQGESGVYIVPAECNTCPCKTTLLNKADIIPGDIFFTTISTYDEKHIFSKSNDVIIETITK